MMILDAVILGCSKVKLLVSQSPESFSDSSKKVDAWRGRARCVPRVEQQQMNRRHAVPEVAQNQAR